MLDKIRLHQAGRLPEEYHPNFGLRAGLDGHLAVSSASNRPKCMSGFGNAAAMRACPMVLPEGLRPNKMQIRIWNEFARKFGWNDAASKFLARMKQEDGLEHRTDIVITFELIDLREGRAGQPPTET
jgi:hypothetical protein